MKSRSSSRSSCSCCVICRPPRFNRRLPGVAATTSSSIAAPAASPAWQDASRATAAHSTLVIADTNSSELRPCGIGRHPNQVEVQRQEANGAHWLEASHDGYLTAFGALHRRRLYMAESGEDIRGEDAIEAETRHDVIAFLTWLAEGIGDDSRFVHQGLTSSDVLDTCFSLQLTQAADLLLADLDALLAALKRRAVEHRYTLTIGRSHGIHAEPTSFGLKLAGHYAEFARNRARLVQARAEVAVCAISGAVGTYAHVDPAVEAHVARRLGLQPETVSTQVIPRDRHAAFFCTLGVIASGIERLATEVRHLQRSEVREAEEFFHPGQKGSSAMPHKRNPVLSENLTGLARIVRAAVTPALENVALWH